VPTLTRRGQLLLLAAAALTLSGVAFGVEEFVLFAITAGVIVVFGLLTLAWRVRLAVQGLRVTVRLPTLEVSVGSLNAGSLVVSNVGRLPTPVVVVEDARRCWSLSHPGLSGHRPLTGAGLGGAVGSRRRVRAADFETPDGELLGDDRRGGASALAGSTLLAGLAPGGESTVPILVPTWARGLASLGAVSVWCTDAFGLFARQVAAGPPAHVMVCPVPEAVAETGLPSDEERSGRLRASGEAATSRTRAGDEFSSLRPYVPGDRMTRLHWPALARSDTLVVREFVEPASGRLTLLVDLRPGSHGGGTAESAITKAAGLGVRALDHGISVELCTSSGERLDILAGTAARIMLLRALALVAPGTAPASTTWRWSRAESGGAVWATSHIESADIVLVTTRAGAPNALPPVLHGRTSTVVVG
jgi:hypothetical protein